MTEVILECGTKGNKKIQIDAKLLEAMHKGEKTETYDNTAIVLHNIKEWCEQQVSDKKIPLNQINKAFNDSLDKSLSPILYSGKFKLKNIETPTFKFPLTKEYQKKIKNQTKAHMRAIKEHEKAEAIDIKNIPVAKEFKKDIHPAADIFPYMSEAEFLQLSNNIKEVGQQETIKLFQGKIIDGRNRYKACAHIRVEPKFEEIIIDDPIAYVISLNRYRRHLDTSQRAWIAAKLSQSKDCTQDKAAKMMKVSRRSVAGASAVIEKISPEVQECIEHGNIPISVAVQLSEFDSITQKNAASMSKKKRSIFISQQQKKLKKPNNEMSVKINFSSSETKALEKKLLKKSDREIEAVFRKIILDFYKIKDSNH